MIRIPIKEEDDFEKLVYQLSISHELRKQFKSQILQDHEKAKKWDELENYKIPSPYIGQIVTQSFIKKLIQDHEIVNRLNEEIKLEEQHIKDNPQYQYGKCGLILSKLQKIRDGND